MLFYFLKAVGKRMLLVAHESILRRTIVIISRSQSQVMDSYSTRWHAGNVPHEPVAHDSIVRRVFLNRRTTGRVGRACFKQAPPSSFETGRGGSSLSQASPTLKKMYRALSTINFLAAPAS